MEGASVEHDLVPIITADNVLTGLHPTLHLVVHIVSIFVIKALKNALFNLFDSNDFIFNHNW